MPTDNLLKPIQKEKESDEKFTAAPASATITADELKALISRIDDLELMVMNLTIPPVNDLVPVAPEVPEVQSLDSVMVGAFFNCPECGLRLDGPSLTAIQGSKGANYVHPFGESPKLGAGIRCRLAGQQFKSPIVRLEFVNSPKAADLTAAK